MTKPEQILSLSRHFKDCFAAGSRRTCNPAPVDTDDDYMILAREATYVDDLFSHGFEHCGNGHYEPNHGDFTSWKKGELNLIVTVHQSFYEKFFLATKTCTALNLLDKSDRITLFQSILYSNVPSLTDRVVEL